jgi:hypothetical protein
MSPCRAKAFAHARIKVEKRQLPSAGSSERRFPDTDDASRGTKEVKKLKSSHRNTDTSSTPLSSLNSLSSLSSLSEEDYNIRSEERTQLLATIRERINRGILPTLWACFQLCDVERLKTMVNNSIDEKSWPFIVYSSELVVRDLPLLCKYTKLSSFHKGDINTL